MDNGVTPSERAEVIRKGFFGDAEQVRLAEAMLVALIAEFDQLEAAVARYQAKYGEAVADPLTELRLRLQRGE